jgi:tRNA-(ms[2]io[6]A)-hydroxylase
MLLVAAVIEARSCERFAVLAPHLPENMGKFYAGLLASEARHFEQYLAFAKEEVSGSEAEFDARLEDLKTLEARLISEPDDQFRFHRGTPTQ